VSRGAARPAGRDGNVLGALSLILADRMSDAVTGAGGQSHTAAAALCALAQFLDGCTLDRLRRALGMTSSGTVRLVDRLEAAGLVRRGSGADGRSTSLTLTAAGKGAARRVTAERADGTAWICRLCDLGACGRADGRCPAANAARDAMRSTIEA
jgi:DNA-binding MarR family transcriptional regulator